jgi:hypothetical protein
MADEPIIIDMESAGLNRLAWDVQEATMRLARALVYDAAGEQEMKTFMLALVDRLEKFWWSAGR